MAKSKSVKTEPTQYVPDIDITVETAEKLIELGIEFSLHYPANKSAVFTIDDPHLDREQLTRIINLGGLLHDHKFRILVVEKSD